MIRDEIESALPEFEVHETHVLLLLDKDPEGGPHELNVDDALRLGLALTKWASSKKADTEQPTTETGLGNTDDLRKDLALLIEKLEHIKRQDFPQQLSDLSARIHGLERNSDGPASLQTRVKELESLVQSMSDTLFKTVAKVDAIPEIHRRLHRIANGLRVAGGGT